MPPPQADRIDSAYSPRSIDPVLAVQASAIRLEPHDPYLLTQAATLHQRGQAQLMEQAVSDAIHRWDSDKLNELLQAGADPQLAGPAALKMAAQENNLKQMRDIMTLMRRSGVDLNTIDPHGDTALAVAAREGHHEAVATLARALLESGGRINASGKNGFTPLSEAAYKGHKEAVAVLIDALNRSGENLNTSNEYGFTPLTRGAYMGHWESVYLLADAVQASGGDINHVTPGCGTALSLAIEAQELGAADRLLNIGAQASDEDLQDLARLMGLSDTPIDRSLASQRAHELELPNVSSAFAQ